MPHSLRALILSASLLSTFAPAASPASASPVSAAAPADRVYRNGVVFTADAALAPAEDIAKTRVLQPVVGGIVVHEAGHIERPQRGRREAAERPH